MNTKRIGNLGQWLGLIALVVAIVIMLARHTDIGSVIVAVSSLLFAVATKIKYYSARRKQRSKVKLLDLLNHPRVHMPTLSARSIFGREV